MDMHFKCTCNFKCSYCCINNERGRESPFTSWHFKQTKYIWDNLSKIEDKIHTRINFNGETFIDTWAKRCAFYISKIPNVEVVEIVTNNSVNPKTYLNEFNSQKVSFNCSYHPECITLENFLKNMLILKEKGYSVIANILCIPQIIKKIPRIHNFFEKREITLWLQGMKTVGYKYNGKKYPRDYTAEERKILKEYFRSEEEFDYMVNFKQTFGSKCFAGVDMLNISVEGIVRRCFTGKIGELQDPNQDSSNLLFKKLKHIIDKQLEHPISRGFMHHILKKHREEFKVKDITDGNVALKKEPYPCHEDICDCPVHIIGLEHMRNKYSLSSVFVGDYKL